MPRDIEFSDEFKEDFVSVMIREWGKRRHEMGKQSQLITKAIKDLQAKRDLIDQVINSLTNPKYIQKKERELKRLDLQKASAQETQKTIEAKRLDVQKIINRTYYFMEHLHDLILSGDNTLGDGKMFRLLLDVAQL